MLIVILFLIIGMMFFAAQIISYELYTLIKQIEKEVNKLLFVDKMYPANKPMHVPKGKWAVGIKSKSITNSIFKA